MRGIQERNLELAKHAEEISPRHPSTVAP
jgi:hypothetical protein